MVAVRKDYAAPPGLGYILADEATKMPRPPALNDHRLV
jgi:hypothetical protein